MGNFLAEYLQSRANVFFSAAPSEPSKLLLHSPPTADYISYQGNFWMFHGGKKYVLFSWKYTLWNRTSEMTKTVNGVHFIWGSPVAQGDVNSLAPGLVGCGPVLMPGWVSKLFLGQLLFCQVGKGLLKGEAICRIRVCFRSPKKT